ncbi:MAG: hypothetical protein FWD73_06980 [Polyangiaceae bacterium]|nr:hypothetical protein [Polyangiaceae bacterium]
MISFDSHLLVPALVSALVALAVEWIAKPGLEARKARILGAMDRRNTALHTCRQILMRIGIAKSAPPGAFLEESMGEIEGLARTLQSQLSDVALDMSSDARRMAFVAVGMLRGVLEAKGSLAACVEPIELVAWDLETVGSLMPGRWLSRRATLRWLARSAKPILKG